MNRWKEEIVLFNDALNTFIYGYLALDKKKIHSVAFQSRQVASFMAIRALVIINVYCC